MNYRIAQDFTYTGNKHWRWSAWIDADPEALDQVTEVRWLLHPTFRIQRVTSKDRSTGFRLDTSGWGTFLLRAELILVNAEKIQLQHQLRLEYPDGNSGFPKDEPSMGLADAKGGSSALAQESETAGFRSEGERRPTVFISYSAQDARLAGKLKMHLGKLGVGWLDANSLSPHLGISENVERLISRSDAVFGIVGDDEISPFVLGELETAVASAKPSLALVPTGASVEGLPAKVQTRHVASNDGETLAREVLSGLKILG